MLRYAWQADEDCRLPEASAAALMNAGMFRLAVPRSLAGHEASVRTCLVATAALAQLPEPMDVGYAAKCLREAARLLMSVGGAGSFARNNPVQRLWRHLETGSRQPTLNTGLTRA